MLHGGGWRRISDRSKGGRSHSDGIRRRSSMRTAGVGGADRAGAIAGAGDTDRAGGAKAAGATAAIGVAKAAGATEGAGWADRAVTTAGVGATADR